MLVKKITKSAQELCSIRYWCQDETRLGLKTIEHRKLTAFGIKPIGLAQWQRQAYYLYGVAEPKTGETFFYEFSHLDTDCFAEFLKLFSQTYPQDLHILQLDNGSFHTTQKLSIPQNVVLLFQPPHCPELNPIERLWQHLKSFLSWDLFSSLDELRANVSPIVDSFGQQVIANLTGWEYILQALSVASI